MKRGFEEVSDTYKKYDETVQAHGKAITVFPEVKLPTRADAGSAGYDFYSPISLTINPKEKVLVWSNVKAYMQPDEVLFLLPRSGLGIKKGIILSNTIGVIDSSYYNNETNEGNIGLPLWNTSDRAVTIEAGERIAQGIFTTYLRTEEDNVLRNERTGGMGSSGS